MEPSYCSTRVKDLCLKHIAVVLGWLSCFAIAAHMKFQGFFSTLAKLLPIVYKVLYMSFDKFLLAVESRDLSQANKCLLSQSWAMGIRTSFSISQQPRHELPIPYTANVCRDLQGLCREIGVQGFQIYGDCIYTCNPCNFWSKSKKSVDFLYILFIKIFHISL